MKKLFKIIFPIGFLMVLFSNPVWSQDQYSGIILSKKDSLPIEGARVEIFPSGKTTFSDQKGCFSLDLDYSIQLAVKIHHVGFKSLEFVPTLQNNQSIFYLEDATLQIEEVVIHTGYQVLSKERATGSFVHIDESVLGRQAGLNILDKLQGEVNGLLFDTKNASTSTKRMNLQIRGLSSIEGPMDPLIILNQFPFDGNIEDINPNDVSSITILKDAAAASIWGARAGNGVIVITTKSGAFNQKSQISVRSNLQLLEKSDFFKLPEINPSDFIDVERYLFGQGHYDGLLTTRPYSPISPVVEILHAMRQGRISSVDGERQINEMMLNDIRSDYQDYFLSYPVIQQYSIQMSGGNDKSNYFISGSMDHSSSETKAVLQRIGVLLKNQWQIHPKFGVDISFNLSSRNGQNGRFALDGVNRIGGKVIPYLNLVDAEGNPVQVYKDYRKDYLDDISGSVLADWAYFPINEYKFQDSRDHSLSLMGNIGTELKLTSWANLTGRYQFQNQQVLDHLLYDAESYYVRDLINGLSQVNATTGLITSPIPNGGIRRLNETAFISNQFRGQLNINNTWKKHSVNAIAGFEIRSTSTSSSARTEYGYTENPLNTVTLDHLTRFRHFVTGSRISIPGGAPALNSSLSRFVSMYTNIGYSLKDRYSFTFSARKDASNVFGLKANDRWKPLWSAGMGWQISDESFYNFTLIPSLKFRATYGYQGNVDVQRSALMLLAYTGNNSLTNLQQALIPMLGNPELKWEQVGQYNFAVDFATKNRRINGSIEYYIKNGSDLYGPTTYDYTTWGGLNQITRNVASMKGKGIELALDSRNINLGKFNWDTRFFVNYNSSKTSEYYVPPGYSGGVVGRGTTITPLPGKYLYSIASYRWGGLNSEGEPTGYLDETKTDDYVKIINDHLTQNGPESTGIIYHGSSLPLVYGSFINSFSFADFSLGVNLGYKLGYFFRRPGLHYQQLFDNGIGHLEFANRWQKPGDEQVTDVPRLIYPVDYRRDDFYNNSEVTVSRGDHIRLQYINLDYDLTKAIRGLGLKQTGKVMLRMSDLGIVWCANDEGIDPEYPFSLPPSKSIAVGFQLTF